MLKDFVPVRSNLSTGITISSPVLERNKITYAKPSNTSKIAVNEGEINGPVISPQYSDLYYKLTDNKKSYFTGEISGSVIKYNDIFTSRNFNPYLNLTSSVDRNVFNHSNFNVLFNNVSSSRVSNNRRVYQPILVQSGSLFLGGYSSSYFAELQDSYDSLKTHQLSRYEGVKVSSATYNIYTSASATYSGDNSYGKTAAIDKTVRKLGLFTGILSSSYLPRRNNVSLKYIVDEFGEVTELNQLNKNWEDVQRLFAANSYLNVSLFNNQQLSNQKSTDGNKTIFESGYAYYPTLYYPGNNTTPQIYFEETSAATGGYVSVSYPYFNTASISASIANGITNLITFNQGISNIYTGSYQFVPNPTTGSLNTLYDEYGDSNYVFSIDKQDILLTYLSDNTYIESRIVTSSYSSSLLQLRLDRNMSTLHRNSIISGSYQQFLILTRVEDETNICLTFNKQDGLTSFGFIIPQNLHPDVLSNINNITTKVKQKIFNDQATTSDSLSGGSFG
jgi:hypothetical protein